MFVFQKTELGKWKDKLHKEKIFEKHISNKELKSRLYKRPCKSIAGKQLNKNGQKMCTDTS
jgi:hypothetical protein